MFVGCSNDDGASRSVNILILFMFPNEILLRGIHMYSHDVTSLLEQTLVRCPYIYGS